LSGGVSKWEVVVKMANNFKWWCVKWEVAVKVVDNVNRRFVKMGSGSQNGKKLQVAVFQNGQWWPKRWIFFNCWFVKWEVVVKVAYNCNCCLVTWEVVLQVVHDSNCQCVKMGSGVQSGALFNSCFIKMGSGGQSGG
jgi:hypothetical protein